MGTYLGQNFLNNEAIIDFIINHIKENADLNLESFEIGPGKCALTKKLSKIVDNLKVFEKDETFYEYLQTCVKKENIIMGDFLSADINKYIDGDFFNTFGNIPYYITSPIFRKLTNPENTKKMKYGIFMIQKEVGEKIKSNASKKSMLWFLLNYNYDIEYLLTVPAKDFTPAPKVDSCLVAFYYKGNENLDFAKFNELLKIMGAYKKKTLAKISKILEKQNKKFLISPDIAGKRFHELTWEEIAQIKID